MLSKLDCGVGVWKKERCPAMRPTEDLTHLLSVSPNPCIYPPSHLWYRNSGSTSNIHALSCLDSSLASKPALILTLFPFRSRIRTQVPKESINAEYFHSSIAVARSKRSPQGSTPINIETNLLARWILRYSTRRYNEVGNKVDHDWLARYEFIHIYTTNPRS